MEITRPRRSVAAVILLAMMAIPASGADRASLTTEDIKLPSPDAGIQVFVRNKHPVGRSDFGAERTVLFVHGATHPADTSFDLELGGYSWMDYIAESGFDVCLVDLPGYGKSTRPPQMNEPADKNPPWSQPRTRSRMSPPWSTWLWQGADSIGSI
jgi:pimeloyl-ACP methyl ester carboxylesterase